MFPGPLVVLYAIHAMERASQAAAAIHGKGTPEATARYQEVLGAMFGEKPADKPPKKPKKRRGHTKKRRFTPSEVEETPTTASLAEVHDSATALADLVLLSWAPGSTQTIPTPRTTRPSRTSSRPTPPA